MKEIIERIKRNKNISCILSYIDRSNGRVEISRINIDPSTGAILKQLTDTNMHNYFQDVYNPKQGYSAANETPVEKKFYRTRDD